VAVIIVAFNSEKTIGECLKSLEGQSVPPREVVVVDGGSRDGTLEVARRSPFAKTLSMPGANQSACRNAGVRESTSDIVAFLDSDCTAQPDWVKIIEAEVRSPQEVVGGPYFPAQDTDFAKTTYRFMGATTCRLTAQFARREDRRKYVKAVAAGNCAFTRELFKRVGGFDEKSSVREDSLFCMKVRESGCKVLFTPEMWVRHRWRGWDGLKPLAEVAYDYGRIRIRAARMVAG
jgi:glycosyltransferase involved in cell wall biosynthesis